METIHPGQVARRSWSSVATWGHRLRKFGVQVALILAAVEAYRLVRTATEGSHGTAIEHSLEVFDVERVLGIDVEQGVQSAVLGSRFLVDVVNTIYVWGFWSVVSATLLLLFIVDRRRFRNYRNALFLSGSVGLAVFAAYPVAPPRMLAGFVDTVHLYSNAGSIAHPGSFTNEYAAMPSFHVGWLVLAGVATMPVVPRRGLRPLLLVPSAAMTITVMATANHYLLDAVAGTIIALAGLLVAQRMPTLGAVWTSIDRRMQPFGGVSAAVAKVGVRVGAGLVPYVGARAVYAYRSAGSGSRVRSDESVRAVPRSPVGSRGGAPRDDAAA